MERNNKKKTANRPRPRGKKRRLRKDRVTLVATILVAFLILIICFISRCSDNDTVRAGGDFSVPVPEAIEAGRRDAQAVERTAPGTMDRQRALFNIHVRESELRAAGYIHAADQYIGAAREYIATHHLEN